ncbi:MoxR family ATPase [Planococcus sp. ISL-109]|uniref:AAA family ATPase n=1 Tax=Planococcus sp. ISL-109 TaxID=2819166 RepID=UPI001BE5A682|nr:MoxR family ATPase [Planococcus sp. ISL-109]MBT2582608.1 AAA family ATPase [Planococcus sp. ISL-109]
MAKVFYDEVGDRESIYQAAVKWKEQCLLLDGSLLHDDAEIWTLENLKALKTRFNDNPSYTEKTSFDQKFEAQLKGAPPSVYQLAIEVIYIYYLFPYYKSINFRTKQLKLENIASWGDIPYNNEHPMLKSLELGIGATGTFFNVAKFEEISFIVQFAIILKEMEAEQAQVVLNDPWKLKDIIVDARRIIGKNVQVQHIISHLLEPDYFECMASAEHKRQIAKKFNDRVNDKSDNDVDKQIYEIRQSLEAEGRYNPVNFYHTNEIYQIWHSKAVKAKKPIIDDVPPQPVPDKTDNQITIAGLGDLVFENGKIIENQIQTALNSGKHIILTGPPGTGKSKLANEICRQAGAGSKLVTATSNWTTYDTIGGYKPQKNGELYFDPGLILQCFKDKSGTNLNQWLIIDEINRADIDKAFGPLFSVLTGDEVTLPYEAANGQQIVIKPENGEDTLATSQHYVMPDGWRMIGTMNTIDKSSLFEMSYAFMRRFAFIPVGVPKTISTPLIETYLASWLIEDYLHVETLTNVWKLINQYRKIGPAIVHDIARYTVEDEDFTSAIILYVLPQFEGLSDYKIKDFVVQLTEQFGDVIVAELLQDFVEDFFQIGVLDD